MNNKTLFSFDKVMAMLFLMMPFFWLPILSSAQAQETIPSNPSGAIPQPNQLPGMPTGSGMPQGQGSYDPSAGGAIPGQQGEPAIQGGPSWYDQVPAAPMGGGIQTSPNQPGQVPGPGQSGAPNQTGTPGSMMSPGQGTMMPNQTAGTPAKGTTTGQNSQPGK